MGLTPYPIHGSLSRKELLEGLWSRPAHRDGRARNAFGPGRGSAGWMPEVPPAEHGFGLFGPDFGVPIGGLCLSAFVVVQREGRLLAGRMDPEHEATWVERWAPNVAYYEGDRHDRLFEGARFPATYLEVGESPDAAARRVWHDQLGFDDAPALGTPTIVSDAQDSRRAPGAKHWDVLFLYETEGPPVDEVPEHWAELSYHDPDALVEAQLVMMHGELLEVL